VEVSKEYKYLVYRDKTQSLFFRGTKAVWLCPCEAVGLAGLCGVPDCCPGSGHST